MDSSSINKEALEKEIADDYYRVEKTPIKDQNIVEIEETAKKLLAPGKGILAADESGGSIHKKFESMNIPDDEQHRRDYRNIFFTTPNLEKYINEIEKVKTRGLTTFYFNDRNNKDFIMNTKYEKCDSSLIKINVVDDGSETIKVSAWINEGDAENVLKGNFFTPVNMDDNNQNIENISSENYFNDFNNNDFS